MKRSNIQILKKAVPALLLSVLSVAANAQKLPNVQQQSLRSPANIKIDGKTNEWDDKFQAYNHATDIFYTVANDDDKLYLVVQATDRQIINKIIGGGVTLTIQKSGKKTDKDGIIITYPLFDAKDRPYVRGGGGAGGGDVKVFAIRGGGGGGAPGGDAIRTDVVKSGDSPNAKIEGDSIMNVYNKRLDDKSKNIGVIGIPGLDTLISVYNEDGIKTGERFNNKMVYTYELSIDLKKLGLSVNDAAKFAYHIKLNGAPMGIMSVKIDGVSNGAPDPAMQERIQQLMAQMGAGNGSAATDFWGEYTLAKK